MAKDELNEVEVAEGDKEGMSYRRPGILGAVVVLVSLAAVYLVINLILPGWLTGFASTYVAQPLLWCGLVLAVLLVSRRPGWEGLSFSKALLGMGLLLGAFHIALILISTLFTASDFVISPHSHSVRYLFLNTVFFVTAIVGLELSRAYLLRIFGSRYKVLALILTALVFAFVMLPLTQFTNMTEPFPFVGGTWLPLLAQNILASLLAMLGGPVASIAYWFVLKAFEWYSPILPDLPWIVNAFAGTMAAVIGILVMQSFYGSWLEPAAAAKGQIGKKGTSLTGWVLAAMMAVIIIFMSFGALGFHPTIVGSGSMSPALEAGDIAVVRVVSASHISQGDIIQFQRGDSRVIHRVVEVRENGTLSFITKGDASESIDRFPVYPGQIEGKVQFRIPKVGWVGVWIKGLIS